MRELPPRRPVGAPRASGPAQTAIRGAFCSRDRRSAAGGVGPLAALALSTLSLSVLCAACHTEPVPVTPKHAVDAYTRAVEEERYDDAYALLSREARRLVSREEFQRRLQQDPDETALLLAGLGASSDGATVRATITGKNGETLDLVYEGDAWRIEERAVDLYGQRTPRDALSSFVRAYDAKRWDVLLRFVPDSERAGMDAKVLEKAWHGEQKAEIEAIVEGLRASLVAAPIEELGGQASMTYAGGGTVELVSERGVWKIQDFK